jgi:hypothetical protein
LYDTYILELLDLILIRLLFVSELFRIVKLEHARGKLHMLLHDIKDGSREGIYITYIV